MRAVLILNPTSGLSALAEPQVHMPESNEEIILRTLHTHGIEPEVWHTTLEDPGEEMAKKAADEHVDLVIAAGGDGTIHAVASGLIKRESTLGIIPMGTMNNLARSLGIPSTLEEACAIIGKGETRTVDVGSINGQIFLEVAGAGLEAALFPAAEEIKQSHFLSTVRGAISGLFTLFTYKPSRLKISFDGAKKRSYHALQVTICNTPYYGAHFAAAPEALMDDGMLDVVIYRRFSKLEYIKHAISISQGRRVLQPKIRHLRVKSMRISSEHPLEIQADGYPHGYTPAVIEVIPGALRICVPATSTPRLRDELRTNEASPLAASSRRR
jgi:diacylglycerol kinase (ATP)